VKNIVTASLLAFALAGCAGANAPPSGPPVVASASAEDQTCSRDAECVLVQDCCGCERQGRQLAIHRDRVEALTTVGRTDCGSVSCTVQESDHVSCRAGRAVCLGGRCVPDVN
jgi:hypothetical protein